MASTGSKSLNDTGSPAAAWLSCLRSRSGSGRLHRGYQLRGPAGAADIATARLAMLGPTGIQGACEQLARDGVLPVFAVPTDTRFTPVPPP